MSEERKLEDLKKDYEAIRKKYELPSFQALNEDFEIEKIDGRETEFLLREIRRSISEKTSAYLRFIEGFLNPQNCPMFLLALIKNINTEEKKILEELYLKLGKSELESIRLDNINNEKQDAEFIKKSYKEWQEIKKKFEIVVGSLIENIEKRKEGKEKGYLG